MSYFTLPQLEQGLKIVKKYTSYNFRAQIFFDQQSLCIYLPKGKTPSRTALKQLGNAGWKYNEELHSLSFKTPDINELLTHDNKNLREQAVRHLQWLNTT